MIINTNMIRVVIIKIQHDLKKNGWCLQETTFYLWFAIIKKVTMETKDQKKTLSIFNFQPPLPPHKN
jgi:hypothetical protein